MKQQEMSIFEDIYKFGNYLCETNLNNKQKEFLKSIKLIYDKYLNLEYPVIKCNEEASELYIVYYINNYINHKIDEKVFLDYLKKLGIILKNDFSLFLKDEICFQKINECMINIFKKYKYIYQLAKDNNLVILLHNRVNINNKGTFSVELYGDVKCSVINIYQNNDNLNYIFILAHEIGHFIYEFCKDEINSMLLFKVNELDKEKIADDIAIVILRGIGYKIDNYIIDSNFFKTKEINDFLKKNNKKW